MRQGESLDKRQFLASFSQTHVHRGPGRGPTRPNFRGTAIMTVIFLHLEERAHFLRRASFSPLRRAPHAAAPALRRRREYPAPAILLKPTATIAPHSFFFLLLLLFPPLLIFCFSAPCPLLYSDTDVESRQTIQRQQ